MTIPKYEEGKKWLSDFNSEIVNPERRIRQSISWTLVSRMLSSPIFIRIHLTVVWTKVSTSTSTSTWLTCPPALYLYYKYLSVVSMAVRRRVDDVTGSRESMDVLDPDGTGDTVSSNTWSHREVLRKNVFQILNLNHCYLTSVTGSTERLCRCT